MLEQQVISWNGLDILDMFNSDSIDLIICDLRNDSIKNIIPADIDARLFRQRILGILISKLKAGGSLYTFMDKSSYHKHIDDFRDCEIRNMIIWSDKKIDIGNGQSLIQSYIPILYITKGEPKTFNVSNPESEYDEDNPTDVWTDIPLPTIASDELVSAEYVHLQKPEKIIERIVLTSSNPEETALSVFSDFGTTAIVCRRQNRFSITVENNDDEKVISINRIDKLG
jgi:DNA modification methylase